MRTARRLAAAVIVGFGMIFASRRPDQHWSERPTVTVVDPELGEAGEGAEMWN
jgi:hypothetical protein